MPEAIHSSIHTAIDLYQIKQSLGKRGKNKDSDYHPGSALPKSSTTLIDQDDFEGNGNKSQRWANAGWNSTKSQASSQDVGPEKTTNKPKIQKSRTFRDNRGSDRKIHRMTHFQVNSDMHRPHAAGRFTGDYPLPGALELVPEASNVPEFDVDPGRPRLHVRRPERGRSSANVRKASGDLLEEVTQFAEKEEEAANLENLESKT